MTVEGASSGQKVSYLGLYRLLNRLYIHLAIGAAFSPVTNSIVEKYEGAKVRNASHEAGYNRPLNFLLSNSFRRQGGPIATKARRWIIRMYRTAERRLDSCGWHCYVHARLEWIPVLTYSMRQNRFIRQNSGIQESIPNLKLDHPQTFSISNIPEAFHRVKLDIETIFCP